MSIPFAEYIFHSHFSTILLLPVLKPALKGTCNNDYIEV